METTAIVSTATTSVKGVSKVSSFLSKITGRPGLILQKHSPEILMTVGIVGIVGSTILACRATLKAEEVIDRHEEKMEKINEAWEQVQEGQIGLEDYSEQDHKKDLTVVYVQTAVDYVKLYGPAVTLLAASIFCILGAHSIMKKRNVALMAAYKALEEGFNAYRKRVIEEHGEQKDYMYKHGLREEEVIETEVGEDGKTKKVKTTKLVDDGLSNLSPYARRYSRQTSTQWSGTDDHSYNIMFIQCQQNSFNDLLQSRGHVYLNEVYDCLGLERDHKYGQMVGWVKGHGDDYIDFGLDFADEFMKQRSDEFILDFNVDGVIWDKI